MTETIRMMIEIPGDLEAVRRLLLKIAPRMESQQPGITRQLETVDMSTPMRMVTRRGEVVLLTFELRGEAPPRAAVKVAVEPPVLRNRLGIWWWRWRMRWIVRLALKMVRQSIARQALTP